MHVLWPTVWHYGIACITAAEVVYLVLQILQLEMERLSLAKAVSDRNSKQRLQALDGQLKKLKVEQVRHVCITRS